MKHRYLYRGVNPEMYRATNGELQPKAHGKPFRRMLQVGDDFTFGSGAVFGESPRNAVLMHQKDSSTYPSAGISTTPKFENAKAYATGNGKFSSGAVYVIDVELLGIHDVTAYQVDEYVTAPQIDDDQEVILVALDFGNVPQGVVHDVIWV